MRPGDEEESKVDARETVPCCSHIRSRDFVSRPLLHLVGLGWELRQVSRHGHLRDKGSELRELRVDTRCAPAIVSHGPDEPANLAIYSRSSRITSPRNPCPVSSELIPIPPRDRVRVDDDQATSPPGPRLAERHPECAVRVVEGRLGRSFSSAATCCRKARFSITRSARRRRIARVARVPRETRKMRTQSMARRSLPYLAS